jgi:predicted enzyme related to lactoylglutathione lyase
MTSGPSPRGTLSSSSSLPDRDRARPIAHQGISTDNGRVPSGDEGEPRVFRVGGVSYLRIPAEDPRRSAAFYEAVFGWSLRGDPEDPSFEDGTGHVIGHFMTDLAVAGEAGVRPYIFVERVDETLDKVVAHGGEVLTSPYQEGDLLVATFRDPPGNVLGVWQRRSGEEVPSLG